MLRRILILSMLSWAILAVPSLCRAGVLEHACDCGIASDCAHEDDCASDPCSVAKPATAATDLVLTLVWVSIPGLAPVFDHPAPTALDAWARSRSERFALPPCLRSGARPLLV